jgi:hypothetical protein
VLRSGADSCAFLMAKRARGTIVTRLTRAGGASASSGQRVAKHAAMGSCETPPALLAQPLDDIPLCGDFTILCNDSVPTSAVEARKYVLHALAARDDTPLASGCSGSFKHQLVCRILEVLTEFLKRTTAADLAASRVNVSNPKCALGSSHPNCLVKPGRRLKWDHPQCSSEF